MFPIPADHGVSGRLMLMYSASMNTVGEGERLSCAVARRIRRDGGRLGGSVATAWYFADMALRLPRRDENSSKAPDLYREPQDSSVEPLPSVASASLQTWQIPAWQSPLPDPLPAAPP